MAETAGRETVAKNRFSKSIGAGIGSLTSGGRDFYTLEHKTTTQNFRAGDQTEIIIDHIELGRDPKCTIRYSEEEATVSRKHAAIVKEGNGWVLYNHSSTNPTLLNGHPVFKKFYLSGGDEIQLSVEGPKLGFIIPQNNKTGSLPIGKRMTLFREQALKPYKRAVAGLAALLVIAILGGGFLVYYLNAEKNELQTELATLNAAMTDTIRISSERADSLQLQNEALAKESETAQKQVASLRNQLRRAKSRRAPAPPANPTPANPSESQPQASSPTDAQAINGDIYYIQVRNIKVTTSDGESSEFEVGWSGTGFLTKDNRFITARHVVEPWFFVNNPEEDEDMFAVNLLLNNFGARIEMTLVGTSPNGQKIRLALEDFRINRNGDIPIEIPIEGQSLIFRHALQNPNDVAWARVNKVGNIESDAARSMNLRQGQEMFILGYPLSIGAGDPSNMSPIFSTLTVGRDGLENGSIITSGGALQPGYSGSPVMIKENGVYKAVGIVSGGWGATLGMIVPIKSIYP